MTKRCQKMAFDTKEDAARHFRGTDHRIRSDRVNTQPRYYECRFCGKWHATSLTKKVQRSLVRRGVIKV